MVYSTWIFAEHIQLWNRGRSLSYGVRVEKTILSALFQSTITGVVVWGFRSPIGVACESYLVKSRRPLWFRSSQANLSLSGFNTPALSVGGSVMQHIIISLRLASHASLSSPFKSLLCWSSLFSRSVESGFSMVWSQGSAEYTASPFPEHNCWSCGTGF